MTTRDGSTGSNWMTEIYFQVSNRLTQPGSRFRREHIHNPELIPQSPLLFGLGQPVVHVGLVPASRTESVDLLVLFPACTNRGLDQLLRLGSEGDHVGRFLIVG